MFLSPQRKFQSCRRARTVCQSVKVFRAHYARNVFWLVFTGQLYPKAVSDTFTTMNFIAALPKSKSTLFQGVLFLYPLSAVGGFAIRKISV